jgi:competence protein ComEA
MRSLKTLLLSLVLSLALSLPAFAAASVDVNSADAATIAKALNGVGQKKAEAIVAYRKEHGAFKSADELTHVKGVSQKLVDKNREVIAINGGSSKPAGKASAKASKADVKANEANAAD